MADRIRFVEINLPLMGTLSAGAGKRAYQPMQRLRILQAQLTLENAGATSGNTDVDVNKNGTSILAAPGLRIAQGAATKRVTATPVGAAGHPGGVFLDVGDEITVDVDAIPGTASANGCVHLWCQAVDN